MVISKQLRFNLAKTKLRAPLVWMRHRHLYPNDVLIASYPRSGSTWMRFLLFEILSGQEADFPGVQRGIPDIEHQSTAIPFLPNSGRLLQTHELFRDEYQKAIYLVRDVRDVMISEHLFWVRKGIIDDDFDRFFVQFLSKKVNPFGFWGDHVESWLNSRAAKNDKVLFIRFENMRNDVESVLLEVLEFLGIDRDIFTIKKAVEHNTIANMQEKENKAPQGTFNANRQEIRFIRQGFSGGWKSRFTEVQLQQVDARFGSILLRLGYSKQVSILQ